MTTSAIEALKVAMQKTARSRFFAAKRLQTRDQKITRLTALSSAYLIALTALPYFLNLPDRVEDHVNLVTLIVAIIVLVSSLLQYSRLDVVSAEQHHRCGLEINEILRKVDGPKPPSYEELADNYSEILQKYSINHEDVDFWAVTLDRPHEYTWMTWRDKLYRRSVVYINRYAPDGILIGTTVALLIFLIGYVLPTEREKDVNEYSISITARG